MDANSRNLGVIFDMTLKMMIPLFQRPYVWNEEQNWEPLWSSIKDVAERRYNGSTIRPAFLGAIVLDQMKTKTGEVEARKVIDGQQRLITLQIALLAMRNTCMELDDQNYYESFKRLTENHTPSDNNDLDKYKVWPLNIDRKHFQAVFSSISPDDLIEKYDSDSGYYYFGNLIPECYMYFHDRLIDWIGSDTTERQRGKKLEALYTAVRQDLQIVVIDLGETDDGQVIFETLNALGTPLLPADLVKNFLFQRAEKEGLKIEKLYEKKWSVFDDSHSYWRVKVRQGRLTRPRVDLFLQHYLVLKTQDEVSSDSLYNTYKDYVVDGNNLTTEQYIGEFRKYADIYESFANFPEGSREGLFFYRLEQLDTTTVYPFLLEVFNNNKLSKDKNKILGDIESYLVRRAICCHTTKNYNRIFIDLIRWLSKNGKTSNQVREYLLSREGVTALWPSDDEVRSALLEYKVYNWVKRSKLRMILEAVEQSMRSKKSEKISIDENLTIEHIMPIGWGANWKLAKKAGIEESINRDEIIHTIGNLTLLNKRLNPALSNLAWTKKKKELEQHTALAMNRRLLKYKHWHEANIKKRGNEIAGIVLKTWKKPDN